MASYKDQNTALEIAISRLEIEKRERFQKLKDQLDLTTNSLKPISLLKDTFHDFQEAPDLKSNLIKTVASISGGYLSKRLVLGNSKSFIKRLAGYALQYGVTTFISKKVKTNSQN